MIGDTYLRYWRAKMNGLAIRLLGPFQTTLDDEPVTQFESEKVRALLAYLAAEAEQPQRREFLAEMFWPGRPEGAARANLRHALGVLRAAIGDRQRSIDSKSNPPFLLVTREMIQFNLTPAAWVDTAMFEKLFQSGTSDAQPSISQLEKAVKLYRGAFIEDISIGDSNIFQEWVLLKREQFRRRALDGLHRLSQCYEAWGKYTRAQEHAWRLVELAPLDEKAHRQIMRLLALAGKRTAALAQYEICRRILVEELGVEPESETTELYKKIYEGKLEIPPVISLLDRERSLPFQLPGFLKEGAEDVEPPVFVGREEEMARLFAFLEQSLKGHDRLVFITGGPGRGKTALLDEFARRAMDAQPELLVVGGNCNAYAGVGDPYLPFRDVMAMLTGDVEAQWAAGSISRDHAWRLWKALPLVVETLLEKSPSLIGAILSGEDLLSRIASAFPDRFDLLNRLQVLTERPLASPVYPKQSHLFEQYNNLLRSLSHIQPLVLFLDDMHWADSGSIGLLFHLGRRLSDKGNRIMIACAYRPEEVGWGHPGQQHSLSKALSEFKCIYGDVWVDLAGADQKAGRRFVDAFLDTQSNRLGERFRAALFQHTEGHPLFTIELLRAMQERGDLIRDAEKDDAWIEGPALNWDKLPARVEAVIEQRIGRLDPELQQIVAVASVEGEVFTAQVMADVQNIEERRLLHRLSSELERQHRLVREQGEVQVGESRLTRYKFGHVLIQNYLYQSLSRGERRLLHGQIATSLEAFYEGEGQLDTIAVQLAHHFYKAGDYNQALRYFTLAGKRAARLYANDEAIAHYTQAIGLAKRVSLNAASLARLHSERGLAYETLGEFDRAYRDHEEALQIARAAGEHQMEWQALLTIGKLWSSRDYDRTRDYYERALKLARQIDDPTALANSLNQIGNWYLNAENPQKAKEYHLQALEICQEIEDRQCLASTLDLLGIANLLVNDLVASLSYYDQAVALFRGLDDRPRLVSSLTGRGFMGGAAYSYLTAVPVTIPGDARHDFEEALKIAREIDSPPGKAWALWALSLLNSVQGQFGQALEAAQSGLCVASSIGHREWETGNRYALGVVYSQLFALEEARRQLKQALTLAGGLQSQHWIYVTTGSLAAACCLGDDLSQAQAYLETVITPQTPMDTLAKRYCWARQAELALFQGDPALTIEIVDRLIASATGLSPKRAITFLWWLKGKALAAKGQPAEASTLLLAAIENAQTTGEYFLLWRLYASLGRLFRMVGHEAEAEKAFTESRALIEEMAATIPDGPLKENFRQQATNTI